MANEFRRKNYLNELIDTGETEVPAKYLKEVHDFLIDQLYCLQELTPGDGLDLHIERTIEGYIIKLR